MQRTLEGKVIKLSSKDTIKVRVESKHRHPKYGKIIATHRNYLVHYTESDVAVGDVVIIGESRKISKNKSWIFVNKVEKHK
jgi:small subunit ribosomal protein S17